MRDHFYLPRNSAEARELGLMILSGLAFWSYLIGPVRWRSAGGFIFVNNFPHGMQVFGAVNLAVLILLVVAHFENSTFWCKVAHGLGAAAFILVGIALIISARPGGESQGGPFSGAAFFFIGYQHRQAALDLPRLDWRGRNDR
jgi:hypothetical protein